LNPSGASKYSRELCIRYLAGILNYPAFWLNMGIVHSHVAKKLCCRMVWVLKDIGIDILTLGLPDEVELFFDYGGIDFLATTLLAGLSGWVGKIPPEDWSSHSWYGSFRDLIQLLRR
jgi:hypothetical protein